jgi:predicted lipoprotein with Yx(FWY)xxD motif
MRIRMPIQPPDAAKNQDAIRYAPWWTPGVFVAAVVALILAVNLVASAFSQAPSKATSTPTRAAPATLMVHTVTPLGPILVDGSGRTLYLFEADTGKASTCSGACARAWPPLLTSDPPHVGPGVTQALVGTMPTSDGTLQVTYNGHPLYYFAGDRKAGETKGEGLTAFGAGWDAVSPPGNKIEQPGG